VTPLGVAAPAGYERLYRPALGQFGKARSLICPWFDASEGGRCTIWRHRNGVCRSWYCKHTRGAVGHAFWKTLTALFSEVEGALARHCVLELDVGPAALRALVAPPPPDEKLDLEGLDETVDDETHRARWGSWAGRERELYVAAWKLVAPLAWEDIVRIAGVRVRAIAEVMQAAHADLLSPRIPDRLELGMFEAARVGKKTTSIVTYSKYDALDLPNDLVAALAEFDGGRTSAALRRIVRRHGLELAEEVVRQLVDFGVLVPVGS
jgi:hypothetical protein